MVINLWFWPLLEPPLLTEWSCPDVALMVEYVVKGEWPRHRDSVAKVTYRGRAPSGAFVLGVLRGATQWGDINDRLLGSMLCFFIFYLAQRKRFLNSRCGGHTRFFEASLALLEYGFIVDCAVPARFARSGTQHRCCTDVR